MAAGVVIPFCFMAPNTLFFPSIPPSRVNAGIGDYRHCVASVGKGQNAQHHVYSTGRGAVRRVIHMAIRVDGLSAPPVIIQTVTNNEIMFSLTRYRNIRQMWYICRRYRSNPVLNVESQDVMG